MSTPSLPTPAGLFVSLLFRGADQPQEMPDVLEVVAWLEHRFGPLAIRSEILPFHFTRYYEAEMGAPLWRQALSFERLVEREQLVEIKLACMELERRFLDANGNRRINLDPGLLTAENLVLATGKNFTHRIYLGRGIFADLTLMYQHKQFQRLPWTYPDYASPEMGAILLRMRTRVLESIKRLGGPGRAVSASGS